MYRPFYFEGYIIIYLTEIQDIASPKIFSFAPAKKKKIQEIMGVKDFLKHDFVIWVCLLDKSLYVQDVVSINNVPLF